MRSYVHHVCTSMWKRRLLLLLLVAIFATSMVFLQYNSVHADSETTQVRNVGGQRTLRTFDGRGTNNASDRLPPRSSLPLASPSEDVNDDKGVQQPVLGESGKLHHNSADDGNFVRTGDRINMVDESGGAAKSKKYQRVMGRYKKWPDSADQLPIISGSAVSSNVVVSGESQIYVPMRRIVHFDMKGAPPKISYLKKLIPLLKRLGATGLLLEYEDMFPYDGPLKAIAAHNHFSRQEVRSLLQLAKDNELDVIPLVQTFGHLEFVLKVDEFQKYREVPAIPQALCPSRNESLRLVEMMIDQVMAMHPDVRWLHIGCDEVFQLGLCPICRQRSRDELFLQHVATVASYVRNKYNVNAIVWDDMFHHYSADTVRQYDLGRLVEPMLWTYVSDIYRFISSNVWSMYAEVFPYIWAASAYKGAFGETLTVPDVKRHLENNLAWVEVLARERGRFREIRGLALTGWQRYDHFATLCELLPAAVPSLSVSLLATSNGFFNSSLQKELYDTLQCMKAQRYSTFLDLHSDPYLWSKMSWCFFPGVSFFKVTERLVGVRRTITDFLQAETVGKAWLTEYNIRHNFSSSQRIDNTMTEFSRHYYDVETLVRQSRDALREAFDEYTVAEWIEQNVYPILRKMDLLQQAADSLKKPTTWPVRPFEPLPELQRFNIGIPDDNS